MRFRDQFRATTENRPFRWLFAAFLLQALGVGVILAGVDFFATYTLDDPDATTFLFIALVGPALVTMPFWNWFGTVLQAHRLHGVRDDLRRWGAVARHRLARPRRASCTCRSP